MNKKQASLIIENTFNKAFNRNKFISFAGNLFNLRTTDYSQRSVGIFDTYKQHVQSLEVVAKFSDGKNEIDVLIVTLVRDTSLDKARTMQRNFVARYLSEKQGDAAIVAFTSPDAQDWRFSLIKMDYKFKATDTGVKVEQEVTPAKRWSFLVGKNENSHTAQSQLVGILANDEVTPTLDELEQAFSIETVTNEFFAKYTDLFLRMKESLDVLLENDPQLKADFESKEVDTADFAKKTMGQMAFLYFLQKKGWFGVLPDKEWGAGVKNFLRDIFERRNKYGENFFDDVLEPLFYEALAQDRGNDAIYTKLDNCRMPFLNGGLFEPMNGYSWETTHIRLPDELFSNDTKTKEGDIGDGILDVFDRYNFTVNESEPLEQEVAVDPEMLGKVFENLLEVKERGNKGTFYTPREIVHYMCQESLINYLETKTDGLTPRADIESLIQQNSQIIQNDKSIIEYGGDKSDLMLPQSIREQAIELDDLLANIKVCDPAVGSGAFPLGMLNEIVSARAILGVYLRNNLSSYSLKLHTISNSIYGVDIDPGAVEIAKLRFWLSLVVEEDNPTPLPNLEHKIMQGDSLISQYEGIELFDDDFLNSAKLDKDEENEIKEKLEARQKEYFSLHNTDEHTLIRKAEIIIRKAEIEEEIKKLNRRSKFLGNKSSVSVETGSLFDAPEVRKIAQRKAKLLQVKIAEYVTTDSQTPKENLKKEIDNLKWELIEASLEEKGEKNKLDKVKKLRKQRIKPFFIWKLEFGEVFKDNSGFDVVIGNPPYVTYGLDPRYRSESKAINYRFDNVQRNTANLFSYFIEKGISLLNNEGSLAFIVPHSVSRVDGYRYIRKHINDNSALWQIVDEYDQFNNVTLEMVTLFCSKSTKKPKHIKSVSNRENKVYKMPNNIYDESGYYPIYYDDIYKKMSQNAIGKIGGSRGSELDEDENGNILYIGGKNVKAYNIETGYKEYFVSKQGADLKKEEIVITQFGASPRGTIINTDEIAPSGGCVVITHTDDLLPKVVLALINSLAIKYFFDRYIVNNAGLTVHLDGHYLKKIPIPEISILEQKPFVGLVDEILKYKENNKDTTELENQINKMVYKLYKLTNEESTIIEKTFN
jgi:methylase of polypeptide subunit release factors